MRMLFILFFLTLIVACQNNDKALDIKNLEVDKSANNEEVKHYKAKSLHEAIKSLPFQLKVPTKIPSTFNQFQPVFITDWNDTEDGKDIAIELRATSKDDDSLLGIYARDFDMSILNAFKNEAEKISLNNNQEVYFLPSDKKLTEWHSVTVSWVDNNVFYSAGFTGTDLKTDEVKQTLLNLVNQRQMK